MNSSPLITIANGLIFLGVLGLAVQALIGLSFFISSVWEKERRATIFAAVQFVGIAEINPLWVYSHRGEIFHENWEDWGRSAASAI